MSATLIVERAGEEVTRFIGRRQVLRRAAAGIFGVVAAWAVDVVHLPTAEAVNYCQYTTLDTNCNPVGSGYCSSLNPGYCSGANCAGGCVASTDSWSGTGCWCTSTFCGSNGNGYYFQCCDCACPGGKLCTCRNSVLSTVGRCTPVRL